MMNYVVDKFDFARVSKLPPWYSNDLAYASASLVAYSAVGHLLFAVWANSFYRIDEDPLVASIIGDFLYSLCDAWEASAPKPLHNLFGAVTSMRTVARRALMSERYCPSDQRGVFEQRCCVATRVRKISIGENRN